MNENPSRRRLGRGLAALIGDIDTPNSIQVLNSAQLIEAEAQRQLQKQEQNKEEQGEDSVSSAPNIYAGERLLQIKTINCNPRNPRRHFAEEDIADLAQSISEHGLVQPVVVRPSPMEGGFYELIAGERRWRAAQMANLTEIPVLIRDVDDRTALQLAIIENVQRADLNPLEEALGYKQLIEEHGYNQADLAQIIGKSRSHLTNMIRLLKLPHDVLELLDKNQLSMGHARCLINVENASELAHKIVKMGLSVRQAEDLAARGGKNSNLVEKSQERNGDILLLEKRLAEKLGFPVFIRAKAKGLDIRFHCQSLDQIEDICRHLEQA